MLPQAPVVDPNELLVRYRPLRQRVRRLPPAAGCDQQTGGRTAADIQDAIDGNLGGMGFLSGLTVEEVQAIADVLPQAPVVYRNQPPDGIALYASECAGCHQPLDVTTKPGRMQLLSRQPLTVTSAAGAFSASLTVEEVQAIADALPQADNPGP